MSPIPHKTRLAALAAVLLATALVAAPGDQPAGPDAARIAALIKQLGSDSFEEREQATKELEKAGAAALEALRAATKDGELEVQVRAQGLVKKAEEKEQAARRQAEAARVLAPRKVRLNCKEAPLAEAVADLAKQSGYPLQVHDPEGKLAGQRVSLATGEVTFWEALDRLCAAAGLVEAGAPDGLPRPGFRGRRGAVREIQAVPVPLQPLPPPPAPGVAPGVRGGPAAAPAAPAVAVAVAQAAQGAQVAPPPPPPAQAVAPGPAAAVGVAGQPGAIVLTAGTPAARPTSYSGAARVRALPVKEAALPPAGAGEALVPLELRLEPRLQVQGVTGVRVSKAVDDQGQTLDQLADPNADAVGAAGGAIGVAAVQIQGGAVVLGTGAAGAVTPVRLKKGAREAKALKELTGTLTVQVVLPPEPVITVDKILKAQGETFKGKDGGFIKVTELTRTENSLTVKLEMEAPPGVQGAGGLVMPGWRRRPVIRPLPAPVPLPAPGPNNGGAFQVQIQPMPVQAQAQVQIQIVGNGNVVFGPAVSTGGLTLEDDQGQTISPNRTQSSVRVVNGQVSQEQVLGFPLQKGQEPAKLIYTGSRVIEVEVPFALKDVPLS